MKKTVLSLLLATAAAIGAAVPAEAADRRPYGSKWRFASVKLDGHLTFLESSDTSFNVEGEARYRGGRSTEAFDLKLSDRRDVVIVAKPLEYTASTTASIATNERSWDCSYVPDELFTPVSLAAILGLTPNGVTITWTLVPPGWACPDEAPIAPSFDMPTTGFTTKHPLRAFTGRRARLPIRIAVSEGDPLLSYWKLTWKGSVVLERTGR